MNTEAGVQPVLDLGSAAADGLVERAAQAAGRAIESGRPTLASITVSIEPQIDVAATVFATRGAQERYAVWEEPERDGFALGALGSAFAVEGGPESNRFAWAATGCSELIEGGFYDDPAEDDGAPAGAGPIWIGGFAFAADGGATSKWQTLPAALLTLPNVSIARHGDRACVTANIVMRPGGNPEAATRLALSRLHGLRTAPLPLIDPSPVQGHEIRSVRPPYEYEQAVNESARRIGAGELEKVVLAREVEVEGATPFHPGSVFDGLRTLYPSCFCFCIGTPEAAFVGASPELLVRREGARVSTVAMAGSTRRSADPRIDDHLGERLLRSAKDRNEHEIVVRTIERALRSSSVWVTAPSEPSLIKVANIQHLATPIHALLTEPKSVVELAGTLHPTGAVGGEPWITAQRLIAELEQIDRGWYSGPVGWMDTTEDGEFCAALRCALLQGRTAHCYAGVGVVADSDGEDELAETEIKLQALLSVLAGQ